MTSAPAKTVEWYTALGFSDVEIASATGLPLDDVWRQLAALPESNRTEAIRKRLIAEKRNKPLEVTMHGDELETPDGLMWWCGICKESFPDPEHLAKNHSRSETLRRYERDLYWLAQASSAGTVIRAGDAEFNLVERTKEAEQEAITAAWKRGDL